MIAGSCRRYSELAPCLPNAFSKASWGWAARETATSTVQKLLNIFTNHALTARTVSNASGKQTFLDTFSHKREPANFGLPTAGSGQKRLLIYMRQIGAPHVSQT